MSNPFKMLVAVTALLLTAEMAAARVVVRESTRYYNVSGKTGAQLLASIRRRGTRGAGARHAIATTQVSMQLKAKPVIRRGRCVYANTTVVLNLTYRYPRWSGERRASPRVRRAWKKFMARVIAHERTHGRIAKKYATRVDREYRRTNRPARSGCADRGGRQGRRFARLMAGHDREHRRFDRRESRASARVRRLQRALGRQR